MKREFTENSKNNKENYDLLHNGLQYRLSLADEVNLKIEDLKNVFSSNHINYARVKLRINIYFEYMEVSMTQTYSFKEQNYINQLRDLLLKKKDEEGIFEKVMCFINDSKKNHENEIEMELSDLNYLRGLLENKNYQGFNSCIDKFFRNFEILYMIDETLNEEKLKQFFNKEQIKFVKPFIGKYLEKIITED